MKRLLFILLFVFTYIFGLNIVKAGTLSVSANTSVKVGQAVSVKINISGLAGRFRVTSSDNSILSGSAEDFWESSQTVTFSAKKTGKATITVTPVDVADFDSGESYTGSRSVTITVLASGTKESIDINKTYSSNNNLKSLSISGQELDPVFDKDTLEYKVSLDSSITSINIKAVSEDDDATIKGDGEVAVSLGTNTILITVVAENGNEKVYKIIAEVEDANPINVKIGKKKYTVLKNKDLLNAPDNYSETTVLIDGVEVPALTNEVTGYILVGLKDNKGNIKLYIYNPSNGKYTLYKELGFDAIKIQYIKNNKKLTGYKKYQVRVNDEKIEVLKKHKKDDYALIYGMNLNDGKKGWYSIDLKQNTIQRYNDREISALAVLNNKYLITIIILTISSLMLMLFMLILMIKIRKFKR